LRTGDGSWIFPNRELQTWPASLGVPKQLLRAAISVPPTPTFSDRTFAELQGPRQTDIAAFVSITSLFYLSILSAAIFWWRFRRLRSKNAPDPALEQLVPEAVMQRAEERWANASSAFRPPPVREYALLQRYR
jgi:hypothetical protein